MAAIDKIYVNSWEEYLEFKNWCDIQPPLTDKYSNKAYLKDFLFNVKESFVGCKPIFSAPEYVDAYIIRNCPLNYIQEELMVNYGHWSQKRIKEFYENVKNWDSEKYGKCPYWAKLEDFTFNEDGTITLNGLEESTYSKIKKGLYYISPKTTFQYEMGKHFRCIQRPYRKFNRPYKQKKYFITINTPNECGMWYHKNHNSWDFYEEFVISDWTSNTAFCKTIKALKRLMLKWKFPVGTIVIATGRYTFDTYKFKITK